MKSDHDNPRDPVTIDLPMLAAFVDGQLMASEAAALQVRIELDPLAKARVAAWRAQDAALRALCYALENEAPPLVVLSKRRPWPRAMAVAASWLAVGAGLGAVIGGSVPRSFEVPSQAPAFARLADVAYAVYSPEVRHPVEVGAADEAHLTSWLSMRLGQPLSVPSLQEYGYTLVGGRLLPGETGPAAQLMYEDQAGARVTLYVAHVAKAEPSFRILEGGDRRTFYWVIADLGYALSGTASEAKLHAIAFALCGALGGRPESWR
ncbi:MAG TPA: anti-sigma factor [Candidatus Cybelea sp.]